MCISSGDLVNVLYFRLGFTGGCVCTDVQEFPDFGSGEEFQCFGEASSAAGEDGGI